MSIFDFIRGRKSIVGKSDIQPDRYHIRVKNEEGKWETRYMDCEMPVDPEDIPPTIFKPGERYMIWDDVEKRYVHSIKTPGKRKAEEGEKEKEKESRERRDLIERTAEDISKVGDAFEKIGLGFSKVQESAAKLGGGGSQAIVDELRALREELKNSGPKTDFRQAFREELGYLMDMWKFFGFGRDSQIPPQVLDKLPGWSLMMYYPPTKAISEIKEAGKEIVEHAIKTAKGELPSRSEEDYLAEFR